MRLQFFALASFIFVMSCESAQEKQSRLQHEEQARIEIQAEKQRLEEEKKLQEEIENKAKMLYNRYINNSLSHGATPYSTCFGPNSSCTDWGCSEIQINGPTDSDVVVTIKKGNRVVRHAYIKAGYSYTFQLPNGTYQPFFYYGKGWNPEMEMPSQSCEKLKGGFISDTQVGKDDPQTLNNDVLTYSLILQQSGNFSTRPSNENEAL